MYRGINPDHLFAMITSLAALEIYFNTNSYGKPSKPRVYIPQGTTTLHEQILIVNNTSRRAFYRYVFQATC